MNRFGVRWPLQEEAGGGEGGKGGGGEGGEKKGAEGGGDLGTVEERAARMGWVPQDKFRGDKEKWTDAATFVKNGEESLPILRERLRTLERTNIDLGRSVSEFKEMSDKAFDRAYAKAKKDLTAEIEQAAKDGDGKRAAAKATELAELEGEKAERTAAGEKDPVFDGWLADNAWYTDPDLKVEAEGEAYKLRARGEKAEGIPFLDKVKAKMKERFPEKFGNPRRQAAGGVERPGGGGDGGGGGAVKGWEKLPVEAKEAGERYIKQKLYKDKAEYAAAYFAQN